MGSFLTGSAPKANFQTQPTTNPAQGTIQQLLAQLLQSGGSAPGVAPDPNQVFSAPLSPLQDTSLGGLGNVAASAVAGPTPAQGDLTGGAIGALLQQFGYQAPQVQAPTVAPVAPINSAAAFQQGVAAPLIDDFTSQVLPALSGQAGRSAGGAYSSDTQLGENLATKQLGRTLAQQGTIYDLGAQQANQTARLTQAGQNLGAKVTTNTGNQAAGLTGQQDILAALGLTPSVVGSQQVPDANLAAILSSTLAGGAVPQQQQETQIAGQYQDYLNTLNQSNLLKQLMSGFGTAATQQTLGVGTSGSTGLLPGLLQGLVAPNSSGNSGASALLSAMLA